MAQATPICPTPIGICALRVSRLDVNGGLAAGPNNSYVSRAQSELTWTPVVEEGEQKTIVSGCDCIDASYRGPDKLLRFTLGINFTKLQPALWEMMTGGAVILDASDEPIPIGASWPLPLDCDDVQPAVAVEAWAKAWVGNAQAVSPNRYVKFVWTRSYWQVAEGTAANDFMVPRLTGYSESNPTWNHDVYGDLPDGAEVNEAGGFYWVNTLPTADCAYQTASSA